MTRQREKAFEKQYGIYVKKEEKKSAKERGIDFVLITIAAIIYATGVSRFTDPNNLVPGGITGLAIILNRLLPIETGSLIFLLNIPIMILGIYKFGFRFILSTLYAIIAVSYFTNLLSPLGAVTQDPFLAALSGGILTALGIGIIFKRGGTTGGTDIIVKCLKLKFPYLKTGMLFFIIDVIIIVLSALVFRNIEIALYAGIGIAVSSKMLDMFLYGSDEAKLVLIISDHAIKIADMILQDLNVGATFLNGSGAYYKKDKKIILCVTRKTTFPLVEEIVKKEDHNAFMIVLRATEIFGLGYKSYYAEKI